ncbi:MAG: argininosuccinate synthase [Bacteroidia bacterium]
MNNNIILAYSGGLDTTFCAVWLKKEKGYHVHAVTIDTGGFSSDDLECIRERADQCNISSFRIITGVQDYYLKCLKYLIYGNVLKNGTYPLSVSAERVAQAVLLAEECNRTGIKTVAHGSTAAGNDQIRFDMLLEILVPDVKIITPIRDLQLSREQEIAYLKANGIQMDFTKAAYSVNKGIWGTSVGGKETLTSHLPLPESAWPTPVSKSAPEKVALYFEKGELKGVNGFVYPDSVAAIHAVRDIVAPFGIGRDIHVGDTIIGIKGRVGFEAAAPVVIIKAHHALEKHVLSKWQLNWKDQLSAFYGNWLHEGQYFEPVMRDIEAFLENSQMYVSGEVFIELHQGHFLIEGVNSEYDLMKAQKSSYGEMNHGWTGDDVKGFTKIFGNQVKSWYNLHHHKTNLNALQNEKS